ncbi:MAG: metal-dependent transcriptional regulator [Lentisphaeria bacterium]|nr:metal-dependent transcriptional regulator [Victivallales bacterium]MCR4573566.1 metal-dependent transcriptional regulator [Lentisphaeria bacterium]
MEKTELSSNLEDYLEAIAELVEMEGHAHTKDLADKLHITMPSVTNALQTLGARNLVDYQPHSPVTLTAAGAQRAAIIRNRHLAMRIFFSKVLKLEPDEADEAACKIEHIIGEKVFSRFVCLAQAITTRKDCRHLRTFLEKVMPQLHSDEDDEAELIPLTELPEGKCAIVGYISEYLLENKEFADHGLVCGTFLQMEGYIAPENKLKIRVLFSSISINHNDAANILVKPTID